MSYTLHFIKFHFPTAFFAYYKRLAIVRDLHKLLVVQHFRNRRYNVQLKGQLQHFSDTCNVLCCVISTRKECNSS